MIAFPAGEGTVLGYLALPKGGEGPGVLVLHAWWGLNDFFKQVCERLAQAGFVALAPDLYHGKIATTIEEAMQIRMVIEQDPEWGFADVNGAVTFLRQHPAVQQGQGIGCIGFSMGVWYAFATSHHRPADIAAAVAFYGDADPAADYFVAKASYLGHFAEQDEWVPDELVDPLETALRAAGREATFYRYQGVKHWFMEENRPEYNAEVARIAWERTIQFLHQRLD
jgi:carboxymethylenebutenolidase